MASEQSTAAGSTPSAQVVGNAFVHQYYHILHQSPQHVYRFYQQSSKLGRPDAQGDMSFVHGMDAINEKILSMNYSEFTAAITTVDAQESLDGGVIVLVTGHLTGPDNVKRGFTQSFFLATQDKGYYVLNDIFRYVDENDNQQGRHGLANGPVAPVVPEQDAPAEQEQHPIDHPVPPAEEEDINEEEVYNPSENDDGSVVEEEEMPEEEVIDEVPNNYPAAVAEQSSSAVQEEAPKKSYASIVKVMKETAALSSVPTPVPARSAPVNTEWQAAPTPTPAPAPETTAGSPPVENSITQEAEADGRSIYIKSLPLNATPAQLEEEFKRFGPIKPGGIQVRSHKQQGFCFGFVEFEVASAVQSAIEASPIMIGGRQAFVEEKRPTGSRVSSRGRYLPGRGGGFRNDGTRGRGNYGGGRGYGRADYGNRADFGGRGGGRGGSSGRVSESGYQRVEQTGSGGGRGSRPGSAAGNPPSSNAAPRVPAPA